ncbi:MAG: zinc-binding dehydrogenase, partial [Myxococcales bacterium]
MATPKLPPTMQAVELRSYGEKPELVVTERALPQLSGDQVLVKLSAAPINPSDLMFLRGLYGVKKP